MTPPGYDEHPGKRYPVVYFLHGYFVEPKAYADLFDLQDALSGAAAARQRSDLRDARRLFEASRIVLFQLADHRELRGLRRRGPRPYVDGHYRTMAKRESRGLAGHSMGGYGALQGRDEPSGRVLQPLRDERRRRTRCGPLTPEQARERARQ